MPTYDELQQNAQQFESTQYAFADSAVKPDAIIANKAIPGNSHHKKARMEQMANSARVILPPGVYETYEAFLNEKRATGTDQEKAIYARMGVQEFVHRLLTKRPLTFFFKNDVVKFPASIESEIRNYQDSPSDSHNDTKLNWKRKANNQQASWTEEFNNIGTPNEVPPICLANFISPDERRLAALMTTMSLGYSINDLKKDNNGKPEKSGEFQPEIWTFGQVGLRGEQQGADEEPFYLFREGDEPIPEFWRNHLGIQAAQVSEGQLCVASDHSWQAARSSSSSSSSSSASAAASPPRLTALGEGTDYVKIAIPEKENKPAETVYFHVGNYKALMKKRILAGLAAAEQAGIEQGKPVSAHFVGLGTSSWRGPIPRESLTQCIAELYKECLEEGSYPHIDGISLCGFGDEAAVKALSRVFGGNGEAAATHENPMTVKQRTGLKTKIAFTDKPAGVRELFPGDENHVRTANASWDANAAPGNEYYMGMKASSNDPAMACGNQWVYYQNAQINPSLSAHICEATPQGSLKPRAGGANPSLEAPSSSSSSSSSSYFKTHRFGGTTVYRAREGEIILTSEQIDKVQRYVEKLAKHKDNASTARSQHYKEAKYNYFNAILETAKKGGDCGPLIRAAQHNPDVMHGRVSTHAADLLNEIVAPEAAGKKWSSGFSRR